MGKGNHSVGHVQKLKPAVERVCAELGVGFWTEENEGRLFVDLAGTGMGPGQGHGGVGGGGWQQQGYRPPQGQQHGGQQHGGQQHGGQQHGGQQHGGQHNQNQELERLARRFLPRLLRKLEQNCCVVM